MATGRPDGILIRALTVRRGSARADLRLVWAGGTIARQWFGDEQLAREAETVLREHWAEARGWPLLALHPYQYTGDDIDLDPLAHALACERLLTLYMPRITLDATFRSLAPPDETRVY